MNVFVTIEEELSLCLAIVCGKRTLLAAWPEPHILCKHSFEYIFLNRKIAIEDELGGHIPNSGTYDTHWRSVALCVESEKYSSSCESYKIFLNEKSLFSCTNYTVDILKKEGFEKTKFCAH